MFSLNEIYEDTSKRKFLYKLLMSNAESMLKKAKIVTNLETALILAKTIEKHRSSSDLFDIDENFQLFGALMNCYEPLIDEVIIVSAFENFAKSKLLRKMYIVHNFDSAGKNGHQKTFYKLQKDKPIYLNTYLTAVNKETPYTLKETTLSASVLLNSKYSEKYDLSTSCIEQLDQFNKKRNTLHLNTLMTARIGLKQIEAIYELKVAIEKYT